MCMLKTTTLKKTSIDEDYLHILLEVRGITECFFCLKKKTLFVVVVGRVLILLEKLWNECELVLQAFQVV